MHVEKCTQSPYLVVCNGLPWRRRKSWEIVKEMHALYKLQYFRTCFNYCENNNNKLIFT